MSLDRIVTPTGRLVWDDPLGKGREEFKRQAEAIKPAVKQNGRSASYLAHDPSKRHRGPRRGR